MSNKLSNTEKIEIKNEISQYENNKELAEYLIDEAFPDEKGKPKIWKDIHDGYTNYSFMVIFEDGSVYQVRLPHDGKIINRSSEYDILFNYLYTADFVYFDKKTGQAIKKWIPGVCPKKFTYSKPWFIDSLFKQIKALHNLELKPKHTFKPIKFDSYIQNLYRLKFIYKKKFLCLMDRRSNDPVVFSHTDINPQNMIYNKESKTIRLIDFEWSGLASDYYDYANFIRETGINYKKIDFSKYIDNFDMAILEQYLYLCSVYAYLWTYAMPQNKKIIKYRHKTLNQIRKYYTAVISIDKSCYMDQNNENE